MNIQCWYCNQLLIKSNRFITLSHEVLCSSCNTMYIYDSTFNNIKEMAMSFGLFYIKFHPSPLNPKVWAARILVANETAASKLTKINIPNAINLLSLNKEQLQEKIKILITLS